MDTIDTIDTIEAAETAYHHYKTRADTVYRRYSAETAIWTAYGYLPRSGNPG